MEELGGEAGISIITKDGVAVMYRSARMKLKEFKFKRKWYEMMAVRGTHTTVRGTVFIFVIYFKPSLNVQQKNEMMELLTDAIIDAKTREDNPKIYVMGDFNKVPTDALTDSIPTLIRLDSPPTRNDAHLDIILTNTADAVREIGTARPLESSTGIESDHEVLHARCQFEDNHVFEWVEYKTRVVTQEGKDRFAGFLTNVNWEEEMSSTICPTESVEILQKKITTLRDMGFPWKKRKIRSTDKPWISDSIRRKIRRRDRAYKKNKKCQRWRDIAEEVSEDIKRRKKEYYDREAEKMTQSNGSLPVQNDPSPVAVDSRLRCVVSFELSSSKPFDPSSLSKSVNRGKVANKLTR